MPFDRLLPYNDLPVLPPVADLESILVLRKVVAAGRALERLRGTAARLPNPSILLNNIVLLEARSSSEVENIVTTNDELYRAAANPESASDDATKEVLRYGQALWHGFESIKTRPISTNLCIEIVRALRKVEVDVRNTPGTALRNQAGEVVYTPPAGTDLLNGLLANLETYIHSEDSMDPLIKLAVMHYQFEAIHPFTDGNGRTGRILNVLYLVECGLLDLPVLYLSNYILRRKREYYRGLRSVTEKGLWEEWLLFMLQGIEETAVGTCAVIEAILARMKEASIVFRAHYPAAYSKDLMEVIFSNPYCRIRFLEEQLGVSRPTASQYLRRMVELGLLSEVRIGRDVYYVNGKLIEALTPLPHNV